MRSPVKRYGPGQIIPCNDPQCVELIKHDPDVLDILRVANGVLPEQYLLPMYEVIEHPNRDWSRAKYAELT